MCTLYVNTITPQAGDRVGIDAHLVVSGSTTLGDGATDVTTVTGHLTASNGMVVTDHITANNNITTVSSKLTASNGAEVQGHLVVTGDLEVAGTINAITHHETELYVKDKTITISSGSNEADTDGAGINFGGSSDTPIATFLFEADSLGSTSHHLVSSTGLKVTGDFQATTNITASQGLLISNHITANNGVTTVSSDLTASNGLLIPDDTTIRFGTGAGDATIEYDENGTDELRFAGAAATFEQAVTFDAAVTLGNAATDVTTVTGQLTASNGAVITNHVTANNGVTTVSSQLTASNGMVVSDHITASNGVTTVSSQLTASNGMVVSDHITASNGTTTISSDLTASNGLLIPDDTTIRFGTGADATIEYDENGTNELRFAGAAVTFEQDATFDNNVTLGVAGTDVTTVTGQLTASNGMSITSGATITGNVTPGTDDTYNLGSATYRWANVYTGDLHLKNDRGDWTILEEEDYLCVVNNATGKKYKMMLQEIKD